VPAPYVALLDRIYRLEEQYRHDRKIWQDELKEERRARREDARVLREAMYSFYKFMEQEVPQKFVHVEDKIDGFLDQLLRLGERVGAIDDSAMALENRVSDLEGDGDDENGKVDEEGEHEWEQEEQEHGEQEHGEQEHGEQEHGEQEHGEQEHEEQDHEDEVHKEEGCKKQDLEVKEHNEEERKRKRQRIGREVEGTPTHHEKTTHNNMSNALDTTTHACVCGDYSSSAIEGSSLACVKLQSRSPCPTPRLTITLTSTKSPIARDFSPATDFACPLEFLNAPAPIAVAPPYIRALVPPARDFISPWVPKVKLSPNSPHSAQSQCQNGHTGTHSSPLVIEGSVTDAPQSFPNKWSPPARPVLSPTFSPLPSSANNDLMKKRKRDMNSYQPQRVDDGHRQQLMLPIPPPLSLSGSDVTA